MLTYAKAEKINLKSAPELDEAWLEDRIAEDPSIIGLGDLTLIIDLTRNSLDENVELIHGIIGTAVSEYED